SLVVTDGNPATAAITFMPTGTRSAAATVTLVARDGAAVPATATRTLVLAAVPPPRFSLVGPRAARRWAYVLDEAAAHSRPDAGRPSSPPPRGGFSVREVVRGFGDPFYGPAAFGTSGRSAVLTDWPGGGVVGIHGTNLPQLVPGRISHGCIRLRNPEILRLA